MQARLTCSLICALTLLVLATSPAGAFEGPSEVSDSSAQAAPGVGQDDSGRATVAWSRSSDAHVVARRIGADGALSGVVDLSGGDVSNGQPPDVTSDPAGTTTVAWNRNSDNHAVARRIAPDGSVGQLVDVSQQSLPFTGQVSIAADADGGVVVAWRNPSTSDFQLRVFSAGGTVGPVRTVTDPADIVLWGTQVSIAVAPDGTAVATWHRNTDCHIIGRRVAPDGTLGPTTDISLQVDNAIGDTNPAVGVDEGGNATFAWHHDLDDRAITRRLDKFGALGSFVDMSKADSEIPTMANFGMATNREDGVSLLAWQRTGDKHVVARKLHPSGEAGDIVDLSGDASATDQGPAAATDANGGYTVAWKRAGDGRIIVRRTLGSPKAPKAPSPKPSPKPKPKLKLPKSGTLNGSKVTVTISCAADAACEGKLELTAGGASTSRKSKAVLIGATGFKVAAGQSKKLKVKLNRKGKRLVRSKKRVKVTAKVKLNGASTSTTPLRIRR